VNCTAQIPNAASASFACNASGSAPLTSCTLNSCAAGYHASGGHCVLNSCVPNSTNNACGNPNIGSGVQSCSADGSQLVGSCFYTSCTGSNSPDGNGNCVPNAPSCTPNYASGFSYATPGWNAETVTGPNGSWSPGMDVAAAAVAAGTLPSAATTITVTDAVQTVTFTTGSETCNSAPYTGSSFIYNIVPVGSSGNQGWTFSFNSHDLAGSCWSRYYMSNYQVNLPRGTYQLQVIAQDSCSGGNSRCQVGWTFSSQGTTSCPAGYATPAQSVTLPWYVAPTPPSDSCDDTAWYEAHPDHCDKSASGIAN
jgi:hypothetical protein